MQKEDDVKKRRMLDSVYFNNKIYGENETKHILKAMSFVDRKYFEKM